MFLDTGPVFSQVSPENIQTIIDDALIDAVEKFFFINHDAG
jgi:hypothetical protein